ncbi:helix-turn-helix transcriptional regulator [Lacticaseibacillus absianus]|uniref:helix-turn-helix transcriptional regulator n=1 Tax=Lacticaseibacillus absianus TaxID=2729623 RepID=UPI0015CEAED2|nr:helix-turn-helix transcriptional regulator [Lacticaseibacillus absianus]
MQIGNQIQANRQRLGLTQDALAEKLYVSRQTISNWENDRHYPDIENLLLLSTLFGVSLDELVKGDVSMMKHQVFTRDTDRDVKLMLGFCLVGALAVGPSLFLPGHWAFLPPAVLFLLAFLASLRLERAKKQADVRTYQEILAFMAGEDVTTLRAQRNRWHETWQTAKIVLVFSLVGGLIALLASIPYVLWG